MLLTLDHTIYRSASCFVFIFCCLGMLELVVVWWSGGVELWWMELRNANAVSAIYNTSLSTLLSSRYYVDNA